MLRILSTETTRSDWAAKKKRRCLLRNWSRHAAKGMRGYRLDVGHFTKGGHIQQLWGMQKNVVSRYICRSHVTILSVIQVYKLYKMCQGIMNNPAYASSVWSPNANYEHVRYVRMKCMLLWNLVACYLILLIWTWSTGKQKPDSEICTWDDNKRN